MDPISRISGKPCRPAHMLVEIVLLRKAKKTNTILHGKFWNDSLWQKEYRQQIIAANSLLKLFPLQAIIAGLDSKDACWVYSLNYSGLIDIIRREHSKIEQTQRILESQKLASTPTNVVDANQVPVTTRKTTLKDRLRELDV